MKVKVETRNTCVDCGGKLRLGEFAYNQEVCWDCFKDVTMVTLGKLQGREREQVLHMLKVLGEIHGYSV